MSKSIYQPDPPNKSYWVWIGFLTIGAICDSMGLPATSDVAFGIGLVLGVRWAVKS